MNETRKDGRAPLYEDHHSVGTIGFIDVAKVATKPSNHVATIRQAYQTRAGDRSLRLMSPREEKGELSCSKATLHVANHTLNRSAML